MCEQLTSCGIKVIGSPELAIHTTNSHSKTWEALKLEPINSMGLTSPWRELEWKEGQDKPDIRFRDNDDEGIRKLAMAFVLDTWQTRENFVEHCCKRAEYLDARGCTGLTKLDAPAAKTLDASGCTGLTKLDAPAAKTLYASGCTGLTKLDAPKAEYLYASGCT